jgi:uncharacterized membrane protein YhaH (DUF805 family)
MGRKNFLLGLLPVFALAGLLSGSALPVVVTAILVLPLVWVALGLFAKRLRDAGIHPACALLIFIPFVGWLGLAVLAALPGKGSAGAALWKVFATGLSALLVLSALGSSVFPPEDVIEQAEPSATTEVVDEGFEGVDPVVPGESPTEVSEGDAAITGSPEEAEASGEDTEAEVEVDAAPEPDATPSPEPTPAPPAEVQGSGFEARIAQLRVEPEFPSGYDRDLFGGWRDFDGDGCDTRREVLIAESLTPVLVGGGCSLSGGQWYSAFDGVSTTDPSSFDIDHFVPLKEAWDSGAHAWDSGTRQRFANDLDYPGSLIAVTAGSNRSKGARDPAEWLPMPSYRCEYVRTWVEVKLRWNLSADPAEVSAIRSLGC